MGYVSWLRNRPHRPARRLAPYRPRLDVLEARCLPSTVTTLNDAGPGSLRDAIASTPAGGTVDFQAGLTGTIVLTTGELALTKDLTIAGSGADVVTVSGNHASRVFNIGATFTVDMSGLTIADGQEGGAGGIYNQGTLTVTSCTLSGNAARGGGGGILNDGTLTVTNSTVNGNAGGGGYGGGIANTGTATVTNSTFSGSSASRGGGISNQGTLTVTGSTLSGNSASEGGGIVNFGTLTVANSSLSGNIAGLNGGGIMNCNPGTVTLTSSTLSGNSANGTILGDGGGGIFSYGGLQSRNTIIAGNRATVTGPDLFGDLGSQGYNLIGNNQEGSGFMASDLVGTPFAPINPLLGSLQNNGGPTQTMALMVGSPALNAGDANQLGLADQRGVVRSGGVNIGAYQASASALVLSAPDTVIAGTPFSITVQAVDPFQQTAVGYQGMVHFVASNGAMADYTFMAADGGQHTYSGLVLQRAQALTVTGSDTGNDSITGSTTFTITPAAADHLLFLQPPTHTAAGQTITPAVLVAVVDAFGNVITSDNSDTVTLTLGTNPSGGTLSGTLSVTVMSGVATFSDLAIDLPGVGYTLHAAVGVGLPDSDSDSFTITQ
jgi:hypothetical protein